VALAPALALGQEAEQQKTGYAYAFPAPGAVTSFSRHCCTVGTLHFGGGEGTFFKGLGIGAEIGYLGPTRYMGEGLALASLNGIYIFRSPRRPRLEPFITGGVSLALGNGFGAGANFGGGVQYWLRKKVGLRLEFRDHLPTQSFSDHLLEVRVGIVLR
jgi:hypothetical protein